MRVYKFVNNERLFAYSYVFEIYIWFIDNSNELERLMIYLFYSEWRTGHQHGNIKKIQWWFLSDSINN